MHLPRSYSETRSFTDKDTDMQKCPSIQRHTHRDVYVHTHISTHPYPSRQNTNRISLFLISSNQGSLGFSYLPAASPFL